MTDKVLKLPLAPPDDSRLPSAPHHEWSGVVSALPDLLKMMQPHQSVRLTESVDENSSSGFVKSQYDLVMEYDPPSPQHNVGAEIADRLFVSIRNLERERVLTSERHAAEIARLRENLAQLTAEGARREAELSLSLAISTKAGLSVLAMLTVNEQLDPILSS